MKTLNLVYPDKSDIKYIISQFPDGQQQIKIELPLNGISLIQIKSRLNNFKDLELICCAVASLKNLSIKEIHLYIPYLLGSRSDIKFEEGSNNYLKQVICPIINNLNFESVTVLDPHSTVTEGCINNFKKIDNYQLVNWGLANIQVDNSNNKGINVSENCIFISPDGGSLKKIYKLADQLNYKDDIITCSKYRDSDGKLSRVNVPLSFPKHNDKIFVIIDDLIDAGATFINIAKEIKDQKVSAKIYLIITHGIFSKGYIKLSHYFNGIYCTNSYKDILSSNDGIPNYPRDVEYIKQLSVF